MANLQWVQDCVQDIVNAQELDVIGPFDQPKCLLARLYSVEHTSVSIRSEAHRTMFFHDNLSLVGNRRHHLLL